MQTEKQWREHEELKTMADYMDELTNMIELSQGLDGSQSAEELDKIISLLLRAIKEKEKYVIKRSRKWRKKQGFLSKFKDTIEERRALKALKHAENDEYDEQDETDETDEEKEEEPINTTCTNQTQQLITNSPSPALEEGQQELLEF